MSKYTPGPWHVGYGQQARIVYDKDGWGIANAVVFHRKHEQGSTLANAKLIAAAPDLLEALENLENDAGQIPDHAWQMVKSAIRKAKGEIK